MIDVVMICESWLNSTIPDKLILEDFTIFRADRETRSRGVMIAIKNSFQSIRLHDFEIKELEMLVVAVKISTCWTCLIELYFPNSVSFEDLNCIKKVLEKISQSNLNFNNVIICGDFNLDMLNEKDTRKQDLENLMSLSCLSQIKLIDLVFVQNQILNCNVVPNISNSCDHLAIVFEIDLSYEFKSKRIITKYKSD
ncbi:uncharacterized protein B4U79_18626, partial [Dinothrombium tinctorium]